MKEPQSPLPAKRALFLEEQSYRARRRADMAALLPVAGAAILMVPSFFAGGDGGVMGLRSLIYIFAAWLLLVALSALLSRYLVRDIARRDDR